MLGSWQLRNNSIIHNKQQVYYIILSRVDSLPHTDQVVERHQSAEGAVLQPEQDHLK